MGITVELSDELVNEAEISGRSLSRSVEKQIEHWVKIGKAVEENPDLPVSFVKALLIELGKMKMRGLNGNDFTDFEFDGH